MASFTSGSIRMSQRSFYNSRAWKDTRTRYKQSVGGLCERCLAKGIYTPADVVHHKTPINDKNVHDLSISLGWDNLQALCTKCHAEVHDDIYRKRSNRRYVIDDGGKVIIPPDSIIF